MPTEQTSTTESAAVAQTPVPAPDPSIPADAPKPEAKYYEVLTDTWGTDRIDRAAPRRGDVLTADEVGPYHVWAVRNNVIAPLEAKVAKARLAESPDSDDNAILPTDDATTAEAKTQAVMAANAISPNDDADTLARKAANRTRVDMMRTQAAEARSNRENLRRGI